MCDGVLDRGEVCRELLDSAGGSVYGHARCIDQLVAERVALGGVYCGDIDLRPADDDASA